MKKLRHKVTLPLMIYACLMLVTCNTQGCVTDKEPDGASLQVGDPLPEFSVKMNNGEIVSTASLKGKVGVIDFFNTGCPDCQKEFPVIQQLWDLYDGDREVEIVSISREESEQSIMEYWIANDLSFPFSAQETRDVYALFARSIIPRIYISNPKGIITAMFDDNLATLEELTASIEAAR